MRNILVLTAFFLAGCAGPGVSQTLATAPIAVATSNKSQNEIALCLRDLETYGGAEIFTPSRIPSMIIDRGENVVDVEKRWYAYGTGQKQHLAIFRLVNTTPVRITVYSRDKKNKPLDWLESCK